MCVICKQAFKFLFELLNSGINMLDILGELLSIIPKLKLIFLNNNKITQRKKGWIMVDSFLGRVKPKEIFKLKN